MSERSNAASEKKTYTLRAKPCSSGESWGKSKVNEPAQNRNLLSETRRYGNLKPGNPTVLNECSSGSLECIRQLQDSPFAEGLAENLQAHGQSLGRLPAGYRDTRNSGERSCNCIYVS